MRVNGVLLRGCARAELEEAASRSGGSHLVVAKDVDSLAHDAASGSCIDRGGRRAAVDEGRRCSVPCRAVVGRPLQHEAYAHIATTTAERPRRQMDCRALAIAAVG